jgi:hypothetical protein
LPTTLPEPWLSFLKELDPIAGEPTKIPCIGGFAVTQHYGSDRTTVDLDVIDVAPIASRNRLIEAGGKGSPLARKHRVYLDFVGIAQVPYEWGPSDTFGFALEARRSTALRPEFVSTHYFFSSGQKQAEDCPWGLRIHMSNRRFC